MRITDMSHLTLLNSIKTVSYTHLDVYKRQARAMASTIIDDEEPKPQTTDFNADEILTDWFENNENN